MEPPRQTRQPLVSVLSLFARFSSLLLVDKKDNSSTCVSIICSHLSSCAFFCCSFSWRGKRVQSHDINASCQPTDRWNRHVLAVRDQRSVGWVVVRWLLVGRQAFRLVEELARSH
eukprot:Selendium_serpulae@DN1432_c0_g1_i1.p2